jgi:hypothetical protein
MRRGDPQPIEMVRHGRTLLNLGRSDNAPIPSATDE